MVSGLGRAKLNFGLAWLIVGATLISILVWVLSIDFALGVQVGLLFFPMVVGVSVRRGTEATPVVAAMFVFCSAVLLGALLVSSRSFYQTYVLQVGPGFAVGGGWQSVAAAGLLGGFVGVPAGGIAAVVYLLLDRMLVNRSDNESTAR